ncbi:MAG TPA: hypothetical protein VGB64_05090 [Actinomycetota bacterium]
MLMVTFWCSWCGATTESESVSTRVACRRCAIELWKLLGMRFTTDMVPLDPGQDPPEPAAARKQFRFVDPAGKEIGRTEVDPLRSERSVRRRRGA